MRNYCSKFNIRFNRVGQLLFRLTPRTLWFAPQERIEYLTSSSGHTRRNPERWEFQVQHSHPTEQPASANLKGCSRSETGAGAGAGGTAGAGSAKPPGLRLLLLFSTIYGVQAQALFVPQGRRQA